MEKDTKSVKINKELHRELKVEASKRGISLQQLIEEELRQMESIKEHLK